MLVSDGIIRIIQVNSTYIFATFALDSFNSYFLSLLLMKNKKILYKAMQIILLLSILSINTCKKEECKNCYKVGTNGQISGSGEEVCGEASIRRLEYQGYICR